MKTLLILRHGKAQPDAPHGDKARELIERGLRDAAAMGERIHTQLGTPDAIVTSDATRARQTAELVAAATAFTAPLTLEPDIYDADLETLQQVVHALPQHADTVLLVGHNPGFEELTAVLTGQAEDDITLPTTGLAHLTFDLPRWDQVAEGSAQLREIATPRTIA